LFVPKAGIRYNEKQNSQPCFRAGCVMKVPGSMSVLPGVRMAVRDLFFGSIADIHNFTREVELVARKRVVEIHPDGFAGDGDHFSIKPVALPVRHRDDVTGLQN
jgi:hypothetical protein